MARKTKRAQKSRSVLKAEQGFASQKLEQDLMKDLEMERGIQAERRETSYWTWFAFFIIFALIITIIVITIVGIEQAAAELPDKIDVVLYNQPDVAHRKDRYIYQARAIKKYMGFVNKVYVLNSGKTGDNTDLDVTFVDFTGTEAEAFQHMNNISGISEHAIFFSDYTLPMFTVYKTNLFAGGAKPRLFNYFRDAAEVGFYSSYLETTLPAFVGKMSTLGETTTWQDYLFRETTEERVVLRNDFVKDVFVVSSMTQNSDLQFKNIKDYRPLFTTFHISGADLDAANQKLNVFLTSQFPE